MCSYIMYSVYIGWGFHEPREIPDPYSSKPDDWVEDALIVDSTDVKPEGWDDTPSEIPDPSAVEPGKRIYLLISHPNIYSFIDR